MIMIMIMFMIMMIIISQSTLIDLRRFGYRNGGDHDRYRFTIYTTPLRGLLLLLLLLLFVIIICY